MALGSRLSAEPKETLRPARSVDPKARRWPARMLHVLLGGQGLGQQWQEYQPHRPREGGCEVQGLKLRRGRREERRRQVLHGRGDLLCGVCGEEADHQGRLRRGRRGHRRRSYRPELSPPLSGRRSHGTLQKHSACRFCATLKLNQIIAVEPYSTAQGVYNFSIGEGSCCLNGGVELELREVLSILQRKTEPYLKGEAEPGLIMILARGLDVGASPLWRRCSRRRRPSWEGAGQVRGRLQPQGGLERMLGF